LRIIWLFAYSLVLMLLLTSSVPALPLLYFAPFLALCSLTFPFKNALYWAFAIGFLIDLLSSNVPLGTYTAIYCLSFSLLNRYRPPLFEESFLTLPFLVFCFSICFAIFQFAIFKLIGQSFSLTWKWVANELLIMPMKDAIYAIIFFRLPKLLTVHFAR
jgi:rod shape-determining protein MreD